MHKYLLVLLFLISVSFSTHSVFQQTKTLTGKVVYITDGDTFKLLTKDSTLTIIRVANIDCPEKKQPFSTKAKQFVADAIFSKNVTVYVLKKDRYGRSIGNVIYNDSLNLSEELLKNGLAWHYVQYSKDSILQAMEATAQINKIGLWQEANAVPPWEWRSNKKKKIQK